MGPLKTAGRSNELFKNDLILAKCVKKKMHLAKIKFFFNGSLDRPAVLSGPMAFDPIYSHKYFHIFIFFIHQVIADFSKHVARAIATLNRPAHEQQHDFHHVPTNFPHVHVWFMNCDRPLKKEMIIWFVSIWQYKNFLGSENCISIWHPPNRDIREKLYGRKSSRTDP